jgi:MoaA/NifB/PqqE/SkfB family radical SAM enzyme
MGAIRRIRRAVNLPILYLGNYRLLKFASVVPDWVEVRVTEGCNSRCVTCDSWKRSKEGELTTDELIDALRQLSKVGPYAIRFSGGESLTRSDLPELVGECRRLHIPEIQIATNGLLLEQKAERLVMEGGGTVRFDVSLDGIGDTDDKIRGVPDHYSSVLAGIKKVKSLEPKIGKKITVNVFTTLLKQNIAQVPSLVELCERIGARWCFSLLCGNIDLFKKVPVSEFAPNDWKLIDQTIDYLEKKYVENPFALYSNLDILEYARQYMKGNVDFHDYPCTLGYHALCLGSRGEIYPGCYANPPLGNIRKSEIKKTISSSKYKSFVESMYKRACCSNCTFYYEASVLARHRFRRFERIKEILRSK